MSIINKMLRDLDKRGANEVARENLARDVRPPPEQPRNDRASGILIGLLVGTVLVLFGLWHNDMLHLPGSPPPAPTQLPQPVAPAIPASPLIPAIPQTPEAATVGGTPSNSTVDPEKPPAPAGSAGKPAAPRPAAQAPRPAPAAATTMAITPVEPTPRERAEAQHQRGTALLAQRQTDEAVHAFQAALALAPDHVAARQSLTQHYLRQGARGNAMTLLREGLELLPAQLGWAMSLARLQVEQGDTAGAWATLSHSAPHAGRHADYQGFQANLAYRLGKLEEAQERYLNALKLNPQEGRLWAGLAQVLETGGKKEDAQAAYLRALESGNLSPELAATVERKLR